MKPVRAYSQAYFEALDFFCGPLARQVTTYRGFDMYRTRDKCWLALLPDGDFALFGKEVSEALRWIDERQAEEDRMRSD